MRTIRLIYDDYQITAHATGIVAEFKGSTMLITGEPQFHVIEVYDFINHEYEAAERTQRIANEPREPGSLNDALTEELFNRIEDEYDALFPDSVEYE